MTFGKPYALLVAASLAVAGCSGLVAKPRPSTGGTPTPSPTASVTIACNSKPDTSTTIFVFMSLSIAPTTSPTYGTIGGYSSLPAALAYNGSTPPPVAAPIAVTDTDVVQFVNYDIYQHSAVGLIGDATFPPVPYTFPTSAANSTGSVISETNPTVPWSTGTIAATPAPGVCYSATFTVASGSHLFGDLNYYNSSNFRDVITAP